MKKLLSILLSISLISGLFAIPAAAVSENDYPIVVVPGYSASYLYAVEADGSQRQIWGSFEGLNIMDVVLENIVNLGVGLGGAMLGQPVYLAETLGTGIVELLGDIACNPDGTPVIETVTYPNEPATTNYKYLIDEMGSMHAAETEIMADIAEYYGVNGYENIFSFQTDFRLSIVDAIENLREYIDAVLEYTGADKVNLFAVSYGGQISASYLNVYGCENKVHNAVLTVPAIGGAALAYDVMNENIRLDEETLFYFIENGMMLEEDINWLMKAHSLGFLDELLNLLIKNGIKDILGYWGSIWDFIPEEYYDEMKKLYLDPVESEELIKKSDIFHYEILPSMSEKLQECIDNGTNVYIVAGSDSPAVTGLYENSDGIIHLNGATGADCAPLGLRFSDGYTGKRLTCSDESHNHMSPSMNIDASTCYIPEQTWFISGLFHGMTWKDEYTKNLCIRLLFSDELLSVHSENEFPQFMYSTNVCHSVAFAFDNSKNGSLCDEDTALKITNLSEKYKMQIVSVTCVGADMDFDVACRTYLKPGETIELAIAGKIPEMSYSTVDISVNYTLIGDIIYQGERTLSFTVMNGNAPDYDVNSPYTTEKYETDFEKATINSVEELLEKIGLFDLIKMLFNRWLSLISL